MRYKKLYSYIIKKTIVHHINKTFLVLSRVPQCDWSWRRRGRPACWAACSLWWAAACTGWGPGSGQCASSWFWHWWSTEGHGAPPGGGLSLESKVRGRGLWRCLWKNRTTLWTDIQMSLIFSQQQQLYFIILCSFVY